MPRWTGLALFCIALSACQETPPSPGSRAILDELSAREDGYHTTVGALATAAAIRGETVGYAADMHDLLERLNRTYRESTGAQSLMGGFTQEDMHAAMDQMRVGVDSYVVRLKHLEIVADLKEASDEHRAAMNEMFIEMEGMLGDLAS